jgi:hypothetical protein
VLDAADATVGVPDQRAWGARADLSQITNLKTRSGSPSAQVGTNCRLQRSGAEGNAVPRGTMTEYSGCLLCKP